MNGEDRVLEERLRAMRLSLPVAIRAAVVDVAPARGLRAIIPVSVAVGVPAAVAALLVVVMVLSGGVPRRPRALPGIFQALTSGAPASTAYSSDRQFVWLTGVVTAPSTHGAAQQVQAIDTRVAVLDWTGTVRYRFTLPRSTYAGGFNELQTISADGTRALLDDGTVVDEKGAVVGHLQTLATGGGPARNSARWLSDASGVCAVVPSSTGHSMTLKIFRVDGSARTVATVGTEPLGEPSGSAPDTASVVSCAAENDQAVVARYHDFSDPALPSSHNSTQFSVALWAVQLSTGKLLSHQPETRMALGSAFFFGSQNGQLAVEFLWNSIVAGSERDVVLRMPVGTPVPLNEVEAVPDTPAVSADGTRILRRVSNLAGTQTELKLIDASNGRVVRRVVAKGTFGANAVASPRGASFMVEVDGHFALVDGNGGISIIHPSVTTGQNGVGLPPVPGLQG